MKIEKSAIEEILFVAHRLDEKNLLNAYEGNISLKCGGLIYITPTGENKGRLTEDMVAVVDEKGNQIAGSCRPTSEIPMHLETYTIREDIFGVVHSHPAYLTAHALSNKPVETFAYPEMMGNFTRFDCAAYGRPGTDQILKAAIPILKKRDIVILNNHGVLTVGASAIDAMNRLEAAEAITKTLFLADQIGGSVDLSKEECDFFFSLN